nr:MAG TPA: hypothetical protein [Caudoviricetes sp.]
MWRIVAYFAMVCHFFAFITKQPPAVLTHNRRNNLIN